MDNKQYANSFSSSHEGIADPSDLNTPPVPGIPSDSQPAPLSKKQTKRLQKMEYFRVKKRIRKEEVKKRKREAKESTGLPTDKCNNENDDASEDKTRSLKAKEQREEMARIRLEQAAKNFNVIIDCDWEDKHTDRTLRSLTQQIMHCHGINRRHSHPTLLYLAGVGPRIAAQLSKVQYQNWAGVCINPSCYTDNPSFTRLKTNDNRSTTNSKETTSLGISDSTMATTTTSSNEEETKFTATRKPTLQEKKDTSGKDGEMVDTTSDKKQAMPDVKQLVYLTSDAEVTLETLDPDCAYIIGGIVDRNKFKGVTHAKAVAQTVRTAKLPIKENFALAATHVLTVNHVFEILLNYAKYQSWTEAIKAVIPSRKGLIEKESGTATCGTLLETPQTEPADVDARSY